MITLLQITIFVSFLAYLRIKLKRTLPSISDSWYELVGIEKNLFTLFCFSIGFLMLFQTDGSTPLFFLSGAGLVFCGTAAAFRESLTRIVHLSGAISCIVFGLAGLAIERENFTPAIIFVLVDFLLYLFNVRNRILWTEILAFACISGGFLATQ